MPQVLRWLTWLVFVTAVLVATAALKDGLWHRAGYSTHAWSAELALTAVALVCAGSAVLLSRGKARSHLIAFLAVVAGFLGLSALSVDNARSHAEQLVRDYCSYGSQSANQLRSCRSHVTPTDVLRHHTRAARFARDLDADCGVRSGPFCAGVVDRRVHDALTSTN